ncbi:MAG: hypothetical protein KYX62_05345 [Pseudomonadota bacterium]|nr:hypothetical protein [Pseudomonadota bacterium]
MNMTTEGKRRAVFTVLSEFVDGRELWQAMWRWQNNYSDKSQFELNAFLSDCRDIEGIAVNRPTLYRRLIGILMNNSADMKPDPIQDMLQFREQTAMDSGASAAEDWSETFTLVLQGIFAQLRSDTARMVKQYATEQASRDHLAKSLVYEFTLWEGDQLLGVSGVPLQDLRRLLNVIYIGVCESLGPVAADRILSTAVTDAADALAAQNVSAPEPRLLLSRP